MRSAIPVRSFIPEREATWAASLAALIAFAPVSARAAVPTGFYNQAIIPNLDQPVGLALLPDGRLLFCEQRTGRVRLVVEGQIARIDPVLTVTNVATSATEEGLLGIAVDPGWPQRPYLYTHYVYSSDPNKIHVTRFTVGGQLGTPVGDSLVADPASRYEILTDIPSDSPNHNGGTVRFGPDGMLYVSLGDDQAHCVQQSTGSLLGRILRLDVSGLAAGGGGPPPKSQLVPPGNPFSGPTDNDRLTWALGLRNPFRFHIDPPTGDLFIADVGQNDWEEIDWATGGGLNFGWPFREGPVAASPTFWSGCSQFSAFTEPIFTYNRTAFTASVISAGRYRSPLIPGPAAFPAAYDGDYFFCDYYEGFMRRIRYDGICWVNAPPEAGQPNDTTWATGLVTFTDCLESSDGALWYVRQFDSSYSPSSGSIGRIARSTFTSVPAASLGPLRLEAPWPNPTTGRMDLVFVLGEVLPLRAEIRDVAGRRIRSLLDGRLQPVGRDSISWDGRDAAGHVVPAGLYWVLVEAGAMHDARRFAVIR